MTEIDTADLEQIVSTLHREQLRLTGRRKRSKVGVFKRATFLALRVVAYSIPITLAILLLGIFLFDWGGSLQVILLFGWLVVAVVLLLPLTLLNLPLIITAWQQRRPIVARNLLVPAFPSWQLKARWVVAGLTVVAAILAVVLPESFGWVGLIIVLVVVVFPFLLLLMQSFLGLARSNLALMKSVEELEVVLEKELSAAHRESRTKIKLSHEVAVKLSDATDGVLNIERLRAIDESELVVPSQYSVAQSSAFRESLQGYAPEIRLQLLDRAQELGQNRQPQGAYRAEGGENWIWPLSDLGVDLVYEIAEADQQVLVREARSSGPAGGGTDGAG